MSSESNLIALLTLAEMDLYKFGGPILMGLGTVSCILSLAVFTRKNLRKNPCSVYFVAYNVSTFLLIYTSMILSVLADGYNMNSTSYSLVLCRLRVYTVFLFDILGPSYLILASVDRTLVTSRNALTRRRSTLRLAYISITTITLFWLLAHSHALVLMNIIEYAPGYKICYFQPGIYIILAGYYALIKGILVALLMLILGMWTIKNVRSVGRIAPAPAIVGTGITAVADLRSSHSKDRQLIRILLIDISMYSIFNSLTSSLILYQQITQNQSQSPLQTRIQIFLVILGAFSSYVPPCISFYTNLLVSDTFRHEIKNVLMCK